MVDAVAAVLVAAALDAPRDAWAAAGATPARTAAPSATGSPNAITSPALCDMRLLPIATPSIRWFTIHETAVGSEKLA
jgi:hypothetical protein